MADTAFQIQYRQEFIQTFEQHQSLLRAVVTTEAVIKGNQAVFLVAGSGGATATTRGVNGRIPARSDSNTQNTCTLQEWHDLVDKDGFNIFASQGNQRAIAQMTTMAVINRKIDSLIIAALATGTVAIGGSGTIPNVSLFQNGRVKLSNASVPWDSNICMLCQPSFMGYLEQAPEFSNAQYIDVKPYAGSNVGNNWQDKPPAYRWKNCLFIEHPGLPNKGAANESSFLFHKSSVGHALDTSGIQSQVGRNEEQDYSWTRTSAYMGALVLQNSGIVVVTHDGTALS